MSTKLKVLRIQAGMTLENLAQAAGLTRSYVSKLERGLSMPSIGAALKIAKALGTPVESLFSESAQDEQIVILRAPRRATPAHTPRVVSGTLPGHRMVAFQLAPADETQPNHPMSHHQGEEFLYVLKGSITLQLARRTETLHAGDSAHFNASVPHRINAVGKQPASVLLVIAEECPG